MSLTEKISKLGRFLEPPFGEIPLYVFSIPISAGIGLVTYELTGNKIYTTFGVLTPQIAEYVFFRSCEAGAFGEGIKNMIKRLPNLHGKFRKIE